MEDNNEKKPTNALFVGVIAGMVAFLVMAFLYMVCQWLTIDREYIYIATIVTAVLGVGILTGVYQRMVNDAKCWEDHLTGVCKARNLDIEGLRNRIHEKDTAIAGYLGRCNELFAEIEERKRQEQIDMEIHRIGENAVGELLAVVAGLYDMRNAPGTRDADAGSLQDRTLIAVLDYFAQVISHDRERAQKCAPLDRGLWNDAMLDAFFGAHRPAIISALKDLAKHKNKEYAEVLSKFPGDVALYFMRVTLVDPAQQPARPPG